MLTPIEIHNAQHKTGRGYSKKEMDEFLADVVASYESVYKENVELKNSISKLQGEMDYYKSMENTLQKALVLADKTSKDTIDTANSKAEVIEKEAVMKANKIINSANSQYDNIRQKCLQLIQQYNQFKMQFKQIAVKQIDLLDSDFYEISTNDLTQSLNEAIDNSKKEDKVKASDEVKPQNTKETVKEAESTPQDSSVLTEAPEEKHVQEESSAQKASSVVTSEKKADETVTAPDKTKATDIMNSDTKDIPPIDLDSLDSLLKDIRTDFENKNKNSNSEGSKFEFLDNE